MLLLHIVHIYIVNILHIMHILIYYLSTSAWLEPLDQCQSAKVYERRETAQVLYVIPVSILGLLPLVPVGATGTISFAMRRESADFPGAFCDKSENGGDGCRWWFVNSWALGWGTKQ